MSDARQPVAGLSWFDVDDPASPALDELAKRFSLHELQIEDCRNRPQRAKTDDYGGYIFSILKYIAGKDEELQWGDLDIFLGRDFLITVHRGGCASIEQTAKAVGEYHVARLDQIFYRLVDGVVDQYMPLLDDISEQVADLESVVLEHPDPEMLRRIFRLKRKLISFRRIAAEMREVVNSLIRVDQGPLGDDLDPYFRDVYDHLMRAVDLIESYRDLLTGTLDIYLSAVANRTNEVMKILTIWGTVALPLVIITGFFGMNLPLPLQHSAHGTLIAVGTMVLSTILILMYFRRKHWF